MLYPLLLLSIDGNAIVKVAAMTSLSRIALYLGLRDTASLIRYCMHNCVRKRFNASTFYFCFRHNLDYVTNTVCISLRESILLANSQSKLQSNGLALVNFCSRVPMLVEHIMALSSSCSCSSDAIDTSENVLLSDMILNIMDAVDSFAVSGLLNFAEVY